MTENIVKQKLDRCTYCGGELRTREFYFPYDRVFQCQNPECTAQFFPESYELVNKS